MVCVASLVEHRLLEAWASGVVAHRLSSCGLWALEPGFSGVAYGLSCSVAYEIFLDQSLNPCPLHWQVGSYPLHHLENEWLPTSIFMSGRSHGQKSLVGYSPWGRRESDMTEQLSIHAPPGKSIVC